MPELLILPRKPLSLAPFDDWTYDDVKREVQNALPAEYDQRRDYAVEKDHFRNGKEWIGPGDPAKNETIKKQFAPEDAVGEALSNISNAFAEPQVDIVPLEEGAEVDRAIIDEVKALLFNWWDKQRLQEKVRERQYTAAWAGRAGLRMWIPERFLEQDDNSDVFVRPTTSMEEALSYLYVVAPDTDKAMILVDDNTQERIAVFMDEDVTYTNGQRETFPRAELIYLDPERTSDIDAKTIIRTVYSNDRKQKRRAELELGGRFLFSEMQADVLLTDPVLRTQRQLNLLCTLITRIAETAAFRERYIMNARPQGSRTPYDGEATVPEGYFIERDSEGREWLVAPAERTLGAHTTTELVGLPKSDASGEETGVETPALDVVDPVDPGPYNEAAEGVRRRLMRMCGQGHLAGTSDAESSGIAYEQARSVFEKDLEKRRTSEEGMLREFLTAALVFAEYISGNVGKYTKAVRVTVDQHVNPGPRSPDLVRLDLESYEAGTMSRETAMSRLGIEDVEAELERIKGSPLYLLELIKTATEALGESFTPESIQKLLEALGLETELSSALEARPEPTPVPTPNE